MVACSEPFDLLVDMANRSLAQARGLPAQVEARSTWTGIGFVLAGQAMVVPLGEIAELMHVPGWTTLPGVKGWVKGVANVRGRLLPMIDIEAFLGGRLSGSGQSRRVMAIERGDLYTGLIVSGVFGMLHFPVDAFMEKIPVEAASLSRYTTGAFVHDDRTWTVFSPFRLAADSRFMDAAA